MYVRGRIAAFWRKENMIEFLETEICYTFNYKTVFYE